MKKTTYEFAGSKRELEFLKRGTARNYINHLQVIPGKNYILCLRVSSRTQCKRQNLDDQENVLRTRIEGGGGVVAKVFRFTGSGKDPAWLWKAGHSAVELRGILIAESTDRFVRHRRYHSEHFPDDQATERDLQHLLDWTQNVPLMTFLHPDATPGEVRSHQTLRGREMKCERGGRPTEPGYKKRRRMALLKRVLELHRAGHTLSEIETETSVPKPTVHRWITRFGSPS